MVKMMTEPVRVEAHMVSAFARRIGWLLLEKRDDGEHTHWWWLTLSGRILRVVMDSDEAIVWSITQEESWEPRDG